MNSLDKISQKGIDKIRSDYPQIPQRYLDYLADVGWGEGEHGKMIYAEPILPDSIYPKFENREIILLGDDFNGYCFGYDMAHLNFGEIGDEGVWEPWLTNEGFEDYIKPFEETPAQ